VAEDLPEAIILFGASGFIGRNIVDALRGRVALLLGVTSSGHQVPGCTRTIAAAALDDLPELPAQTAIIHVAAQRYFASRFAAEQADILSTNLALTDRVYRFALGRGITEIRAASSAAVYPTDWALQDDARPLDLNAWPHAGEAAYAWSKRWGEIVAELWHRRAGVNTISLRLTNPYGPYDTLEEAEAHVATAFAIRAIRGSGDFAIRGDPDAERDFVFGPNVARAFVESLRLCGVQTAVNCAAGTTTRIVDLARAAMRAAGRVRELRLSPPPPGVSAGIKTRRAAVRRLRELLPDLPEFASLEDGMRRTIAWYADALR
jgi:nucleoside-diphosphate-sugar epimerase